MRLKVGEVVKNITRITRFGFHKAKNPEFGRFAKQVAEMRPDELKTLIEKIASRIEEIKSTTMNKQGTADPKLVKEWRKLELEHDFAKYESDRRAAMSGNFAFSH